MCTTCRAASNDPRGVVVAEHFQNLGPSVRFERSASVFGQSKWIGRPRCSGYLDHHTRSVVTAAELPQPPTAVNSRARAQAEVCSDLPGHERLHRISIWLRRSTREGRRRSPETERWSQGGRFSSLIRLGRIARCGWHPARDRVGRAVRPPARRTRADRTRRCAAAGGERVRPS